MATGAHEGQRAGAVETVWFLRLRWWVAGALALTTLLGRAVFDWQGSLGGALVVLAAAVGSNLAVTLFPRLRVTTALLGVLLLLDTTLLTVVLQLTGGITNPFSLVYLVHVTLAAALLDARWTWGVAAYSVAAYGSLFFLGSAKGHEHMSAADFTTHLRSMWLALALAAVFVAYFASRLNAALRAQAHALSEAAQREERSRRLMSVMTLAAGAAHELGTPLGTIGLVASELGQKLEKERRPAAEREDVRLIGSEVERCRAILERMRPEAAPAVERDCELRPLLEHALAPLGRTDRLAVTVSGDTHCAIRAATLEQLVRVLASNALDAASSKVEIALDAGPKALVLTVADDGPGMDAETLARAGEPFFTTKDPGRGTGLGLFVARAAAAALGGTVELKSTPGRGTIATLTVPRQERAAA